MTNPGPDTAHFSTEKTLQNAVCFGNLYECAFCCPGIFCACGQAGAHDRRIARRYTICTLQKGEPARTGPKEVPGATAMSTAAATAGNTGQPRKKRRGLSISAKLIIAIMICIFVGMLIFTWVVYNQVSDMETEQSERLLESTTAEAAEQAHAWVNRTLTMLEMERDTIEYDRMQPDRIRAYVLHTAGQNEAYPAGMYVALLDGSLIHSSFEPGPEYDATVKSWYQNGLASDDFILGDVYFDEDSRSYVVGASGRLHKANGEVMGVAAADVYLNAISDIVRDISLGDTGGVFLVDSRTGTIVGHADPSLVGRVLSEVDDPTYEEISQMLTTGASGLQHSDTMYYNFADVADSDWIVVSYVSIQEVKAPLRRLQIMMYVMMGIVMLALAILESTMVRRIIGRPVKEMSRVALSIADGDLDQSITYHSTDELGALAQDFNRVTVRLRDYVDYIDEISAVLQQIGGGDLRINLKQNYVGEFAKVKDSLEKIAAQLTGTMAHLRSASQDVAAGAAQISSEAMTLSQGSTEQAGEIQNIATHMTSISDRVKNIAEGAQKAADISGTVRSDLLTSEQKMHNMTALIENINTKSAQIHKVVKTIEDIAFQTNILALNAAVEAARAGTSGQGFAVVADEVRNLATKSSEAAQETATLLGETSDSMAQSARAAEDTAASLRTVVELSGKMDELLARIAEYTKEQAAGTQEISHGISEISLVGQNNVAAAESSAAASEQLAGQAELLKDMVARFRLRDDA